MNDEPADPQEELERLLLEAIDKDEWIEITPGFWEEKKRQLMRKVNEPT